MEAEHEVQLHLVRALREGLEKGEDRASISTLLRQLLDYSDAHFLSEQLLMRLYAYPAYADHVLEHDRLIGELRGLAESWEKGGGEAGGVLGRVGRRQNRFGTRAGEPQLFAAVQGRRIDIDESSSTPEASSDAADLTLGGSIGIADAWFLGSAFGSQQNRVDLDGSGSSFDSSGLLGSVFAGYRGGGWFADLVVTAGEAELDDIERVFELGRVQLRRESGDTDADDRGLHVRPLAGISTSTCTDPPWDNVGQAADSVQVCDSLAVFLTPEKDNGDCTPPASCRHIWMDDSPVTHATVAPGLASLAPIAAGRPKPIVPRPPELIQRRGWSNL